MTLSKKKELGIVVSAVFVVSLFVFSSLIKHFNIYDLMYLIVCIIFLFRYIRSMIKS